MLPKSSCVGIVYSDASDTGFGGIWSDVANMR